jgi:tetratricopeptide (TPR) repeat protein
MMEAAVIGRQQIDALTELGLYDDALGVAREARRVLVAAGPVERAKLETNIGNIYYRLDRYKQALKRYERARSLLESAGDANMRAHVDLNRSNILSEMDQPDDALWLLEALRRSETKAPMVNGVAGPVQDCLPELSARELQRRACRLLPGTRATE